MLKPGGVLHGNEMAYRYEVWYISALGLPHMTRFRGDLSGNSPYHDSSIVYAGTYRFSERIGA